MRLLIVSQYFWPESFIINDIVRVLSEAGHYVEVLTGKPNYPEGVLQAGYSREGCATEVYAGRVLVHRAPLRPRGTGGARNLFLNYISFVWNGLRYFSGFVASKKFDAILVYAPSPITVALPAIWLKQRLGCHLAVWVQDLWPESLSATGFVKNRLALGAAGWMVSWIYAVSDTVLVQSRGFIAPVRRRASTDKIVYFPNSFSDPGDIALPGALPASLKRVLESFDCVIFAGNVGRAQAIGTLIDAATVLKDQQRFRLVIVGSGSSLQTAKDDVAHRGLENVIFAGRFPKEVMAEIFSRSAALLVSLARQDIFALTIPSKVQAYLAAGRPIIGSLDGEGARVIEEAGAGWVCPAEDAACLVSAIRRLLSSGREERERLGRAGRMYYLEHFEMQSQCERLIQILENRGVKP